MAQTMLIKCYACSTQSVLGPLGLLLEVWLLGEDVRGQGVGGGSGYKRRGEGRERHRAGWQERIQSENRCQESCRSSLCRAGQPTTAFGATESQLCLLFD